MRFALDIELGNDAMRTQQEVRAAIARTFSVEDSPITLSVGDYHPVYDENGNRVGRWIVLGDHVDDLDSRVPKSPDENNSCCDGDTFHRANCYKASADYRLQVGNTPTCDLCGESHGEEDCAGN